VLRAVRRQSEAAVFLPLRRALGPALQPLAAASAALHARMKALGQQPLRAALALQVDPGLRDAAPSEWQECVSAMHRLSDASLPCDMVTPIGLPHRSSR
jgi:hypothetical protein